MNPTDCYNPVVKILSGNEFDIDKMIPDEVPTYWEQATKIAKNPFLASKFFDEYMNSFVDTLLGKDMTDGIGVIGKYKAHYGTVEAQGRGTLHCHLLLWIDGSLNPQQIKDHVLKAKDNEFLANLLNYIDNSVYTDVPDKLPDSDLVTVMCHNRVPHQPWRPMSHPPPSAPLLPAPAYMVMGSVMHLTAWSYPVIT